MSDRAAWLAHLREDPDQLRRVFLAMESGRWWVKDALAGAVSRPGSPGSPHAMSARMSELRAKGCETERRKVAGARGLYEYRLTRAPAEVCAWAHRREHVPVPIVAES